MPDESNESATPGGWRDVEVIRHPDSPRAHITERLADGKISFRLFRMFGEGKDDQTYFFNLRHIPALRQLLDDLEERGALLEDRARERRRAI